MDAEEWEKLAELSKLTQLTRLTMRSEDMTLADLSSWSVLTNLTYLKLDHSDISFENMKILSSLPSLKKLVFNRFAEKEYIPLIGQITSLTELNLNWAELNGISFAPLYQLTNLKILKMKRIDLTNDELQHFKSIRGLLFKNSSTLAGSPGYMFEPDDLD